MTVSLEPTTLGIVVMGASAGAVDALGKILPSLAGEFAMPVVVVVHLPPDKKSVLVELFKGTCKLQVREIEDKEPLIAGNLYFAPPDYHVLIEAAGYISLSNEEPVQYSRPSIDVLFESAVDAFGSKTIGVVLSGANADGANGLKAIYDGGGRAIVQQPESAHSPHMPQAALRLCPSADVVSLNEIGPYLNNLTSRARQNQQCR